MRLRVAFIVVCSAAMAEVVVGLPGCVGDSSTQDGGNDVTTQDVQTADVVDAGGDGDALAADADAGPVYGDIADPTRWTPYDMSPLTSGNVHYYGGAFDGRYVYYVPLDGNPSRSGLLTRYDSTMAFSQAGSWQAYDLAANIDGGLAGFNEAVFDGAYLYLVPYAGTPNLFTRYKTNQPFNAPSSYEIANIVSLVNAKAAAFGAGAFDGKYVYLMPCFGSLGVRFDTGAGFGVGGSYSSQLLAANNCYASGAFDGKYVYYVPSQTVGSGGATIGNVTRFDISKAMNDGTAYLSFDTQAKITDVARGYGGAVFDGRYLYLIPEDGTTIGSGTGTLVVRYDTTMQFDTVGSWTTLDLTNVASSNAHGYSGGTFDGRYVYFAPNATSLALRYDTQQPFGSMAAWQPFDLGTVNVALKGFHGAVFDGAHVYFIPYTGPVAVRFDAKTPASLPPFASSFF